jgi:DNA-binding IclR family transcriptional regulator
VVGAISISGPSLRIQEETLEELGRDVIAASRAIAKYSSH